MDVVSITTTILPVLIALIPIVLTGLIIYLVWKMKKNSDQILQLLKEKK
ncbi:MAG: hypothetical protein ACRC5Q_08255 [Culicoidibacterales bacterium]